MALLRATLRSILGWIHRRVLRFAMAHEMVLCYCREWEQPCCRFCSHGYRDGPGICSQCGCNGCCRCGNCGHPCCEAGPEDLLWSFQDRFPQWELLFLEKGALALLIMSHITQPPTG